MRIPRAQTHDGLVIAGFLAAGLTAVALVMFFRAEVTDFRMFYASGRAWLAGQPIYTAEAPNLHPPIVVAALFAPIAALPFLLAQVVWLALSVLAAIASARLIARELAWTRRQLLVAAACFLLTYPAWLGWYQGQVTWLMLYPATRSWIAFRRGRLTSTGLWFAPLVVVKPPLAFVALAFPPRVWLTAGGASAAACALAMLGTGVAAWLEWWRFRDAVFWISWVDNASLWGTAARAMTGDVYNGRLSDVPRILAALIIGHGLMAYWLVARVRQADQRMALAWLTGILVIPIGWVYYLTLGAAAFAASWTPRAWIAWAVLCVPMWLMFPLIAGGGAVIGSVYSAGVLVAWLTWSRQPVKDQNHGDREDQHQEEGLDRPVASVIVRHGD